MVQKICGSFISPALGDNDELLPTGYSGAEEHS